MEMKPRIWLALAALCLLSGSGWIADQFYPSVFNGPLHTITHEILIAILFARFAINRSRPLTTRLWSELAFAGIALLALPQIMIAGAGGSVASSTVLLVFALCPAIVVFLAAQQPAATNDNPLTALLPALAGLGGFALLVPFTWPQHLQGQLWLIAIFFSAVLSAVAALRLHRILPAAGASRAVAVICGAAAIFSIPFFNLGQNDTPSTPTLLLVEALRCLLLDAPAVFLLVWLLQKMPPIAISARYFLIPLVTIIESYLIERPHAVWTVYAGVLLMAISAFVLIRTPVPDKPLSATQMNRYT
jgi:drug/metabolite transporter (DMT)-like permease